MAAGVELRDDDDFPALTLFHTEHGMLLNLDARRFVDETVGDHLTTLALLRQPQARALRSRPRGNPRFPRPQARPFGLA